MDWLGQLYANQPFWVWLAVGALILTAEVATGSGWLLWPAVSAAVVAYLALLGIDIGLPSEIAAFAVLTAATTLVGRRFFKPGAGGGLNDNVERLLGRTGKATSAFDGGYGRVLVDGCEWAAELEDGGALSNGAPVEVARLADGARLIVRPVAALPHEPRRVADFSAASDAPDPA